MYERCLLNPDISLCRPSQLKLICQLELTLPSYHFKYFFSLITLKDHFTTMKMKSDSNLLAGIFVEACSYFTIH